MWVGERERQRNGKGLVNTVVNCLETTDIAGVKSLALPAIGAGTRRLVLEM